MILPNTAHYKAPTFNVIHEDKPSDYDQVEKNKRYSREHYSKRCTFVAYMFTRNETQPVCKRYAACFNNQMVKNVRQLPM